MGIHFRCIYMAVLAGFSGALVSVFAKTAVSHDGANSVAMLVCSLARAVNTNIYRLLSNEETFVLVSVWFNSSTMTMEVFDITLLVRCIAVGGIFVSSALMWIFYSKSLQFNSSTLVATVTNIVSNFLLSTFLSWLVFGEQLPVLWWCGFSLILAGMLLMHLGNKESDYNGLDKTLDRKKTV